MKHLWVKFIFHTLSILKRYERIILKISRTHLIMVHPSDNSYLPVYSYKCLTLTDCTTGAPLPIYSDCSRRCRHSLNERPHLTTWNSTMLLVPNFPAQADLGKFIVHKSIYIYRKYAFFLACTYSPLIKCL